MAKKSKSNSKETRVNGRPSSLIDMCHLLRRSYKRNPVLFQKDRKDYIVALTVKDILDEQIAYKLA